MMRLAVLGVDLGIEFELQVVGCLFGVRVAAEGEGGGFQVDFEGFGGDVGGGDGEVDVISLGVGGRGALGPGY